ncbi:hypothetical protein CCHL11_00191 [Colletotrichum chlorophyti]|uniref:Uncharacterized protein n=1 Tax=Colletotrichum chlorophyti TaxID=708187 RepID=A0A1Q8RV82_9PEZI|nr:hypothetical protein CCHL11_00191 [Colletotrichum chlorophyti]
MERPHRPPPLTIPPPPRTRTRVRRPRRSHNHNPRQARQFKRWLLRAQITNDVVHVAAASILLWIMSWFLYNVSSPLSYRTGPAAVALIIILSTDILLDARSIVHAHDPWPGWTLLLRLLLGASLIAIFWVYIAISEVFAPGFTYWGMPDPLGRVLAYMFLWGIGLWDLLFVVLCRHWLGKEVRRYGERAARMVQSAWSPGPSAHRLRSAGAEEPVRAQVVDVEAARPAAEAESGARVGLPLRMGLRRKSNVPGSVSADSVVSRTVSAPPPPELVEMRPA